MKLISIAKWKEKYNSLIDTVDYSYNYSCGYEDCANEINNWINLQDTIDPVHAAGGCYCKECIYKEKSTIKNPKDYWCQLRDSYMDLDGFCSEGRKDDTKNA